MVDPPELLQFLPGPWSRAHALEAGGTVRANTAWGDPAPTALKVFNIYTAPHRQAPVTLVTPRFTQQSCARESFRKNLGKDFLIAA